MEKVYNHNKYERSVYLLWLKNKCFLAKPNRKKVPFCIIMPPPNANDPLHIGHARFVAIQDIIIRYQRMRGKEALWLPGSDHAGIETQFVFEKKLKQQGKSRFDFDRETLFKMIWDYTQENKKIMEDQLKRLGASCDWSRNIFSLDPKIVKIVYKTFKKLYEDGLVYRGKRIVNYCPRCGTNFSDLEVETREQEDNLYYLDYNLVTVATTRPETIFADVAVCVNPKDKRYKHLLGKSAIIPLINREVPIISDPLVDPNFGTGALKITPGHDALDFEIGQKHNLPIISVIDEEGKTTSTPAKYLGLSVDAARKIVVEDLEKQGKIKKVEKIKHVVGVCYRDKGIIEPKVSDQWFIKVKPLVKIALSAIKTRQVKFVNRKAEKLAYFWLKNLKDWNISRQIVWGIRIPAFRCERCLQWTISEGEKPTNCRFCGFDKLTQDSDTFDTWFSSGQWPFATLKIKGENDFKYFYPTSLMETGYDIIHRWVIRMIMLGIYMTGKVPFRQVLIHGLVRDKYGQKISKSKGNVIDPIEMADKYGSDALRMGLVWGTLIENDISLSEENIKAMRNFTNKIWNVARYVYLSPPTKIGGYKKAPASKNKNDLEIIADIKKTGRKVTLLLEKYRLSEAAKELYDFFWNRFANEYIEKNKGRRAESQKTLEFVLQQSLKLLHPFMPFLTEQIWQMSGGRFDHPLLIKSNWPK